MFGNSSNPSLGRVVAGLGLLAALAIAVACAGCVRYTSQASARPESDWLGKKPEPAPAADFGPPLESGSVFQNLREDLLSRYSGLGQTNAEVWLVLDVSGDAVTDNILQASLQLCRDMAAYFLAPGDTVHVVPFDARVLDDLRTDKALSPTSRPEQVYQAVTAMLPDSTKELARQQGGLLTDVKYDIVREAVHSQDGDRAKVIVILTNLTVDNPWRQTRPVHTKAEVSELIRQLTNGSEADFRNGEWKPPSVNMPRDVKLYGYFVAARIGSWVAPGAHIERGRTPPSPPPPPSPLTEAARPSPAATLILLVLSLLALAALAVTAMAVRVDVTVQGESGPPVTSELRWLGDHRGRVMANATETTDRVWTLLCPNLGTRQLARLTCQFGVTLKAASGVMFQTPAGRTARLSLKPGTSQRLKIFVGSYSQQVLVTVGTPDQRKTMAAGICLAAWVLLALSFLVA